MLLALILLGVATAQPTTGLLRATPDDCLFAERKCIATETVLKRRATDRLLDSYCDAWKDACLKAGLRWDRRK